MIPWPCDTQVSPPGQRHWHHLVAGQKFRILGSTPNPRIGFCTWTGYWATPVCADIWELCMVSGPPRWSLGEIPGRENTNMSSRDSHLHGAVGKSEAFEKHVHIRHWRMRHSVEIKMTWTQKEAEKLKSSFHGSYFLHSWGRPRPFPLEKKSFQIVWTCKQASPISKE